MQTALIRIDAGDPVLSVKARVHPKVEAWMSDDGASVCLELRHRNQGVGTCRRIERSAGAVSIPELYMPERAADWIRSVERDHLPHHPRQPRKRAESASLAFDADPAT